MRIACIGYRDWAIDIYEKLIETYQNVHDFLLIKSREEFNEDDILNFKPEIILWYGWSWVVDEKFTNNFTSIMLHPSPLPRYRGGSPIQNQIINGENETSVTLFKMTAELDEGDIYIQLKMSLSGSIKEIFERISNLGYAGTCQILDGEITPIKPVRPSPPSSQGGPAVRTPCWPAGSRRYFRGRGGRGRPSAR